MTPPTLDEYRRWDATSTRPLTDGPIGSTTAARRDTDARASQIVSEITDRIETPKPKERPR